VADYFKRAAAEYAVTLIKSGMRVGLGTGSTARFATQRLAELVRAGELSDIVGAATSQATRAEAMALGLTLMDDALPEDLDLTIDGADEIDPDLNLIKGGGGALLREKIVAQASRRLVVVADESKLSPRLGTRFFVPVEVLPFGWRAQARYLAALGAAVTIRQSRGLPLLTDQGNYVLDCQFGPLADLKGLALALQARAGIVEHGLFLGLATDVIVAGAQGVRHLRRPGYSA
jgi:ribose 5-phosphate isomerase A